MCSPGIRADPMNDMTILLGLGLGCSALLRVLYRL